MKPAPRGIRYSTLCMKGMRVPRGFQPRSEPIRGWEMWICNESIRDGAHDSGRSISAVIGLLSQIWLSRFGDKSFRKSWKWAWSSRRITRYPRLRLDVGSYSQSLWVFMHLQYSCQLLIEYIDWAQLVSCIMVLLSGWSKLLVVGPSSLGQGQIMFKALMMRPKWLIIEFQLRMHLIVLVVLITYQFWQILVLMYCWGITQNGLHHLPRFDYGNWFVVCRSPNIFSLAFSHNWSEYPSDVCFPVPLS